MSYKIPYSMCTKDQNQTKQSCKKWGGGECVRTHFELTLFGWKASLFCGSYHHLAMSRVHNFIVLYTNYKPKH